MDPNIISKQAKKKRRVQVDEENLKCYQCGINYTPLWRKGPSGPKTMCNACGIKWKRDTHPDKKRTKKKSVSPKPVRKSKEKVKKRKEIDVKELPINLQYEEMRADSFPSPFDPSAYGARNGYFSLNSSLEEGGSSPITENNESDESPYYDDDEDFKPGNIEGPSSSPVAPASSPLSPTEADSTQVPLTNRRKSKSVANSRITQTDVTKTVQNTSTSEQLSIHQVMFFQQARIEFERMQAELTHMSTISTLESTIESLRKQLEDKTLENSLLKERLVEGQFLNRNTRNGQLVAY